MKKRDIRKARKMHDRINRRGEIMSAITSLAENGRVCIVVSGMDCDCTAYSGETHEIDATYQAYESKLDYIHGNAEGPTYTDIISVSEAATIQATIRDLAMEAYEDGHPHYVIY